MVEEDKIGLCRVDKKRFETIVVSLVWKRGGVAKEARGFEG